MLKIKRIYEPASPDDGKRLYIDRLWPRGMKKDEVKMDEWIKDVSPSDALRKWFGHEPAKYAEFKKRYRKELEKKADVLARIKREARKGTVTLLFSARDEEHNNAAAMKEFLSR